MKVLGLILAGGLARRMGGGDKALIEVGGRPLLARAMERLRPQVDALLLNANGDPARFADFGLPVRADAVGGFAGPLAGILTGMEAAAEAGCDHVLSVAVDTPFFPGDLRARLESARAAAGVPLACAETNGRTHPVFGLWPTALADDLRRALTQEDMRKVDLWTARHGVAAAAFPTDPFDPFFNINRPEDAVEAERLAALEGA